MTNLEQLQHIKELFLDADDKVEMMERLRSLNLPFRVNWDYLLMEWMRLDEGKRIPERDATARRPLFTERYRRYRRFGTK